jgi:hypothetical protein
MKHEITYLCLRLFRFLTLYRDRVCLPPPLLGGCCKADPMSGIGGIGGGGSDGGIGSTDLS